MRTLAPHLPRHDHFVSVFGGSGAEILAKPPSKLESWNDLSWDHWNFFHVLQTRPYELAWRLYLTPYAQWAFEEAFDTLHGGSTDPLDRAVAFCVVGNQCHAGYSPTAVGKGQWGYAIHSHGQPDGWRVIVGNLLDLAQRWRRVQCFNEDWTWMLDRFDNARKVLFCIDPPYHPDVINATLPLYEHSEIDHEALLRRVVTLRNKWMIFHYPHPL